MNEQVTYPAAAECSFLTANAYIGIEATLPAFISLNRTQTVLAFDYNHKTYALGISKDGGWLCGFRGALKASKKAELLILRKPEGDGFEVFDARHTAPATMERQLVAMLPLECPPSGFDMTPAEPNAYGIALTPAQTPQFYGAPF